MGAKPPSLGAIAIVVAFALSVFGFTLFVWKSFGGSIPLQPEGYRVHVLFDSDAVQLGSNADVRISGVSVGTVKSVTPRNGKLDTEIQVQAKFAPLPADVKAITRAKTLLGETFVELTPGSSTAAKLPEGGVLPVEQVAETQGLDEVLSAFDAETREDFRTFLNGFAEAIEGRGADLNASLGNLGPASEELETLVDLLDDERSRVRSLVQDTGTALRAIGSRDDQLRGMVTAGNEVLSSTARRDRELMATVDALPPFLGDLRATLAEVDAATTDAAPVLRELRPVAPLLRPAIQKAETLVPQFVPVASELDPVIDAALEGFPRVTQVLDDARPLVDVLDPAAKELRPVAKVVDSFKELAVNGLALAGAALQAKTDGGQHYLRALVKINNESLTGNQQRLGSNRSNAYVEPLGLNKLKDNTLEAFSCANAGNPTPIPPLGEGTPPCREQGPWSFDGVDRQFPRAGRRP